MQRSLYAYFAAINQRRLTAMRDVPLKRFHSKRRPQKREQAPDYHERDNNGCGIHLVSPHQHDDTAYCKNHDHSERYNGISYDGLHDLTSGTTASKLFEIASDTKSLIGPDGILLVDRRAKPSTTAALPDPLTEEMVAPATVTKPL